MTWWKHAVCYQVYVRSFADADGDGLGDLAGITRRLDHLADLGIDAVWITPFYPSPQHDHGYDVADYRDVDPRFGSLADFDALLARAHDLGIRVIIDLVPNHTSSEHAWFRAALAAGPGSPERARYLFRDSPTDGPPNNWESVFGGPAWTQVPDGQWYLHLFDTSQPDLDWRNPEVPAMFADVLRFWLDRGVDGFRVDVTHGLFKEESLPDQRLTDAERAALAGQDLIGPAHAQHEPMWDQPEVHEVYRSWRTILDSYGGDRMAVGEAWTRDAASLARYIRPDELNQSFNFHWLSAPWSATAFAQVIRSTLDAVTPVGASPTWVLSNHDVVRHPTRYGGGSLGLARGRAATMAMLALPGSSYVYQGEELGLEEVDVAPEHWQDPQAGVEGKASRDGCRVPLPWSGAEPPYGFGPGTSQPWLPQPAGWGPVGVAAQEDDDDSTLAFYRRALSARRGFAETAGDEVDLLDLGEDVLAFRRGSVTVVVNCGTGPVPLPGGRILLASGPVSDVLPSDTAVWLAGPPPGE
ncbi:glycoside hydrolase family 13 protein [Nocardioides sp. JQ2195]|uniref:glycoside hydrolase family 13 protein n=1 Tax=Nocardioides sp. JQ2195 TaxID=2592334 RepID=UPI00143EE986|nr:alpha-amylase family glycosyl hydrolase [Nocardioides sp. JQ2195]QIX28028.1 glycoside hydrolase family 13 protein [Nocardioides sp. JQ2195]